MGISGALSGPSEDMFIQWAGEEKVGKYLHQLSQTEIALRQSGGESS